MIAVLNLVVDDIESHLVSDPQRSFDEILKPLITEPGLTAQDAVVRPIWSFARP